MTDDLDWKSDRDDFARELADEHPHHPMPEPMCPVCRSEVRRMREQGERIAA